MDAWGLRRRGGGRCDFLCFAYSPLGPVVAVHSSIDHCYVLWISEVYLHIKRAPDTLLHAAIRLSRRLTPHILAALRLGAPKSLSEGTAASTAASAQGWDRLGR